MNNSVSPHISVIVTTYNQPGALERVLMAFNHQSHHAAFEVIVADDGSTKETADLISHLQTTLAYDLQHCWQADLGFRAAKIRNQAVALARGEYLIFIDGDCIPPASFIARHQNLAERGCFVVGNRVLLSPTYTEQVIQDSLTIENQSIWQWFSLSLQKKCNRWLPLMYLPLGFIRHCRPKRWQGAKTCNLALWKEDFLNINGFEEAYEGWGFEDSDLVIRLIRAAIRRKNGHFSVPVFHLWHPEHDRSRTEENRARLRAIECSSSIRSTRGVDQYTYHICP